MTGGGDQGVVEGVAGWLTGWLHGLEAVDLCASGVSTMFV